MRPQRYPAIITAACFSIQAVGIGSFIAYGVFFTPLVSEFGWSRAAVSGASSTAFIMMGLLGMLVGRLNDRIGPRVVMSATGIFFGLGYLLLSRTTAMWQLYLFFGILFGMGLSSIDVIALTTITRWYSQRRGIMTGIIKVGSGAGQFTLPFLYTLLITKYNWRIAAALVGIAVLLVLVSLAQLLKRDPGRIGLDQDWEEPRSTGRKNPTGVELSLAEALKTSQLWIIGLVNLCLMFCVMTIMVHIVPHSLGNGATALTAAGVLSTLGGVSMVSRFLTGVVLDRIGSKRVMMLCFMPLLLSVLWLQWADKLWMLYVFACVFGLAYGGFLTAISPLVAEFLGTRSHGVLFGIAAYFGTVGGSAGPILAGYLYDNTGSYRFAFWLISLLGVVGLILILFLRPIKPRAYP